MSSSTRSGGWGQLLFSFLGCDDAKEWPLTLGEFLPSAADGVPIIDFLRSLVRGVDLLAIRWQDDNSLFALVSFWADCMALAQFDIARAVLFILMGVSDLLSHSLFFLVVG